MKRMLDCTASDFAALNRHGLKKAIEAAEGRTMLAETIGVFMPMLGNVSNAEFAAAMGADMLVLNLLDVETPVVHGLPSTPPEEVVHTIRKLTGRIVGINLEPVAAETCTGPTLEQPWAMTPGRCATAANAVRAHQLGVQFIVLTGNPGSGVNNAAIVAALRDIRTALGDEIFLVAGKMHASGVLGEAGKAILTPQDVQSFVEAGADMILLPAPGTLPGVTVESIATLVDQAHALGALCMTAIGTSQEGADVDTIRRIALLCKTTGADVHHIGDAGYSGMALPENIFAYSVAIRGIRHTYTRMARSVLR